MFTGHCKQTDINHETRSRCQTLALILEGKKIKKSTNTEEISIFPLSSLLGSYMEAQPVLQDLSTAFLSFSSGPRLGLMMWILLWSHSLT